MPKSTHLLFMLILFYFSSVKHLYSQSLGLAVLNHFCTERDLKYTPGLGLYLTDEFSEKWDGMVSIGYGKSKFENSKSDYKIGYNRTNIRIDLNHTIKKIGKNYLKIGLAIGYEFENFRQSGIIANWTTSFTNYGLGFGLPFSFQSKNNLRSPLIFNFSIAPTYFRLLNSEGVENLEFSGNMDDDIYVEVSLGLAYSLRSKKIE